MHSLFSRAARAYCIPFPGTRYVKTYISETRCARGRVPGACQARARRRNAFSAAVSNPRPGADYTKTGGSWRHSLKHKAKNGTSQRKNCLYQRALPPFQGARGGFSVTEIP